MTVDIVVGATRRRVDARRSGTGWVITLDGREQYAELAPAGGPVGPVLSDRPGRWSMLIAEGSAPAFALPASVPNEAGQYGRTVVGSGFSRTFRSYEIAIEARGRGERAIHVNGHTVPVWIVDARALFGRPNRHGSAGGGSGSRRILTPMPGRIVRVFVKAGDPVTAGQSLLVVEAMKMENEVRAPKAGTIAEVRVIEGMRVEANTLLVVMEP